MPDDFKTKFINAIREGGAKRERAFQFFEERHANNFKGPDGFTFYTDLLELVREAGVSEAVDEYAKRFAPLLDPEVVARLHDRAHDVAEDITHVFSAGGEKALRAFLSTANAVYGDGNKDSLVNWVALSFPVLPQKEQHIIVSMLLKHFLESRESAAGTEARGEDLSQKS